MEISLLKWHSTCRNVCSGIGGWILGRCPLITEDSKVGEAGVVLFCDIDIGESTHPYAIELRAQKFTCREVKIYNNYRPSCLR